MLEYNFDAVIDRSTNFAAKYDELEMKFGRSDLIPLWVADMDFRVAEPIIEAIQKRAAQGIFGYTSRPASYYGAVREWLEKRHGWKTDEKLMVHSPGVVPSLNMIIQNFTKPGDKIIIQPPVYYPFFDVVRNNERQLVENPLRAVDGRYEMDYEHLTKLAKEGASLLLLCSPHNPIGRVWTKEELERLGNICVEYGIRVVADEIHSDLVFYENKHVPFAMISEEFRKITITCIAPSKTFNLAGLQASLAIFPDLELRNQFETLWSNLDVRRNNCFSLVATEAAYRQGEEWLEQVKEYIEGNFAYIAEYFKEHMPELVPNKPEGTYLVWIDCRKMGMNKDELHDFMLNKARIAMDDGYWFGTTGEGFMRLNAACPRIIIRDALERWRTAMGK